MRTKLALLLGFARRCRLLILDEPTEGLDPVAIEDVLQIVVSLAPKGTTSFLFIPIRSPRANRSPITLLMIEQRETRPRRAHR